MLHKMASIFINKTKIYFSKVLISSLSLPLFIILMPLTWRPFFLRQVVCWDFLQLFLEYRVPRSMNDSFMADLLKQCILLRLKILQKDYRKNYRINVLKVYSTLVLSNLIGKTNFQILLRKFKIVVVVIYFVRSIVKVTHNYCSKRVKKECKKSLIL